MLIEFCGDIHGKFNSFFQKVHKSKADLVIQLGDYGIFSEKDLEKVFKHSHKNWKFIRGNHCHPELSESLPNHIKSGYHKDLNLFVINGAFSIDREWRTEWIDFWSNEEHSINELQTLIAEYEFTKPDYVISHDCPEGIIPEFFPEYRTIFKTRTGQSLQAMLDIHQPKNWIFGHHHRTRIKQIGTTQFHCLGELETATYDIS